MKNKYSIINIFLFYSILGNVFERCVMYFFDRTYVSGFMGSIFTPIYGVAILILLYIHTRIKIDNKFFKFFLEFIIFFIFLTFLEYVGGVLIEGVFNKIYWNYDNYKYNIGLYASLETSLVWASLSLFIIYFINPIFLKLEKNIPKLLTIIVSFIFLINLILVLVK